MTLKTEFVPLTLEELPELSARMQEEQWRFVQMLAVNTEEGIDLIYSFMKDGVLVNHQIKGVQKGTPVPSITDRFIAAFVFENEAHDLFGVDVRDIAIDFGGNFYALAQKEPMTIISPEQKAARDKAKKVAAAKAAKEQAAASGKADSTSAADDAAALEAKLADMDPEKAAKVRAAMEAKAKKAAAAKQAAADEKIANLDPEKAAKVKAAMEAKAKREAAKKAEADATESNTKEGE